MSVDKAGTLNGFYLPEEDQQPPKNGEALVFVSQEKLGGSG